MYRKEHNNKENLQMYDKENLQMYDKEKGQKNKQ
jgi:hypothetical protein